MLSKSQINIIIETLKPYSPKKIGIFGSHARGENSSESDIDILYDFHSDVTLFNLATIKMKLQEKLGKEVDLISEHFINKYIKDKIISDMKVVYES